MLRDLDQKVSALMSQQDEINADVTELQTAAAAIQAEIAKLQTANPALDLTGLTAAISSLTALEPPAAPAS